MNMTPDLKTAKINVLTHEQVRLNAEKAAAAAIEEPVPEPEDIAPATFEAVPEAPVEVVAAAEAAPVEAEAAAPEPTPVEAAPEAVPEIAAAESGPSDPSEGEVQSEATVSDLTVEVVAVETVTESDPVTSVAK